MPSPARPAGTDLAEMLTLLGTAPEFLQHAVTYLAGYTGGTYANYKYHLNCWFQWCKGAEIEPLDGVQRMHVELYVRQLIEQGYAPGTIRCRIAPVKGYYDSALDADLIIKDPTRRVRLPKIIGKRKEPFDRDDMRRLMRGARDVSPRHYALVAMLGMIGMRISEACSINVPDIYNQEGGYRVLRFVGKGAKPAAMAIPYQAIPILEAAAGDRAAGPLLTTLDGRRLHRHTAASLVKVAAKRAGFDPGRVHPHLLRAAAITLLMDSGADLRDAQDFARHDDPRTTRQHYDLSRNDYGRQGTHLLGARLAI